ncbi:ATP-binding protein [Sulfurimonas sp. HSL-3221]|uniref:ATP-binding protein n=1 Tax=Sulfurimonadaceae TaxID=2771471 RepID=UPI001E60A9FA|nr:ATP-binding protein [Sulfurimonas sp. HSL-3221]UFS62068.1 ATP-binding protein [Sulfurimonas sp. HSL-3221]
MKSIIGHCNSSIASLKLSDDILDKNTLILGEEGSGKTNLASKIREFVIASGISTLYMDFSDPAIDEVEARYKDEHFFYMQFEESDAFDAAFDEAVKAGKHIYLAVNPTYFSNKRDVKSRLSQTISKQELLDNYYYFFHEIAQLGGFYTKFEDFLMYIFNMINMKKYGLTFLSQPHEIFENAQLKLLFTFLFLGRCSNANYYNTSELKNMKRNQFYYQRRMNHKTLLFNDIRSDVVTVDE